MSLVFGIRLVSTVLRCWVTLVLLIVPVYGRVMEPLKAIGRFLSLRLIGRFLWIRLLVELRIIMCFGEPLVGYVGVSRRIWYLFGIV